MGLFVDIPEPVGAGWDRLEVHVGDVLRFPASGARVHGGGVEIVGILVDAVLGTNGQVLAPAGIPNVVLVRAVEPGQATVELARGGSLASPVTTTVLIVVDR